MYVFVLFYMILELDLTNINYILILKIKIETFSSRDIHKTDNDIFCVINVKKEILKVI